ncbi:13245_t:CDS:2, partial [Acaulospora colombiana]
MLPISDLALFKVSIYDSFVNKGYVKSQRPIWKNPWVIGGAAAVTGGVAATGAVGAAGGAIGGGLGKFFADRKLSYLEEESFEKFIKIELVDYDDSNKQEKDTISKVIFHIYRPVLRDEEIVETFLQ